MQKTYAGTYLADRSGVTVKALPGGCQMAAALPGLRKSSPHFIHQQSEFVNILKAPVHAGKTDVSNLVELF